MSFTLEELKKVLAEAEKINDFQRLEKEDELEPDDNIVGELSQGLKQLYIVILFYSGKIAALKERIIKMLEANFPHLFELADIFKEANDDESLGYIINVLNQAPDAKIKIDETTLNSPEYQGIVEWDKTIEELIDKKCFLWGVLATTLEKELNIPEASVYFAEIKKSGIVVMPSVEELEKDCREEVLQALKKDSLWPKVYPNIQN